MVKFVHHTHQYYIMQIHITSTVKLHIFYFYSFSYKINQLQKMFEIFLRVRLYYHMAYECI